MASPVRYRGIRVMTTAPISAPTDADRRRFLQIAGAAAAGLSFIAAAPRKAPSVSTFGSLRQIDAGVLDIGYAELGPRDGPAVILLHGWPYDIHTYAEVAPLLAAAGYRVLIPHLRGHG